MYEWVLVTTDKRGVFFGKLAEHDNGTVVLTEARNCIYWSEQTKGFLGLAVTGPMDGSRIGPAVPEIRLYGVTSISKCSDEAVARWKEAPWS